LKNIKFCKKPALEQKTLCEINSLKKRAIWWWV